MEQYVRACLEDSAAALQKLLNDKGTQTAIVKAAELMVATFKKGGRVFSCGNGGSMCDAMHFAEELSGRFQQNRAALAAVAISDPGYISCVANDYGYDFVFSRYLEAHARAGDVLLAISTSGKSKNVLTAVDAAKKIGVQVVGLMGNAESPLGSVADVRIATPAGKYADRVQELHIKTIHIMIELIERMMFSENYTA